MVSWAPDQKNRETRGVDRYKPDYWTGRRAGSDVHPSLSLHSALTRYWIKLSLFLVTSADHRLGDHEDVHYGSDLDQVGVLHLRARTPSGSPASSPYGSGFQIALSPGLPSSPQMGTKVSRRHGG